MNEIMTVSVGAFLVIALMFIFTGFVIGYYVSKIARYNNAYIYKPFNSNGATVFYREGSVIDDQSN